MITQLMLKNKLVLALPEENITLFMLQHDYPLDKYLPTIVGFDPGSSHLGLAEINSLDITLWEIKIPRGKTSEERIQQIWKLLSEYPSVKHTKIFVIEGASYADKYRQIELQDIRCAATAWAMLQHTIEVQIIPPNTIRKVVFGSAKIKNPWKEQGIPDNAAAALGCALYPIMKGQ